MKFLLQASRTLSNDPGPQKPQEMEKSRTNKKWDMEKTAHDQDQVKNQVHGLVQDLEPGIVFNENHGI